RCSRTETRPSSSSGSGVSSPTPPASARSPRATSSSRGRRPASATRARRRSPCTPATSSRSRSTASSSSATRWWPKRPCPADSPSDRSRADGRSGEGRATPRRRAETAVSRVCPWTRLREPGERLGREAVERLHGELEVLRLRVLELRVRQAAEALDEDHHRGHTRPRDLGGVVKRPRRQPVRPPGDLADRLVGEADERLVEQDRLDVPDALPVDVDVLLARSA